MAVCNQLGGCDDLNLVDREHLNNIISVLKLFKDAQKILGGDKYVTSSLVSLFVDHIRESFSTFDANDQPKQKVSFCLKK